MSDQLKKRVALLEKQLAKEMLTARLSKVPGMTESAIPDAVERAMARFDINEAGQLRVKPSSGIESWATPESFANDLRSIAPHFFSEEPPKSSTPSRADIEKMSPEEKIALANERARPKGW